jgi:response regulator RpfG family c-di-GMP phosphodiesterase
MSKKILFVDDDQKTRRAYRRRLQEFFELETADSGKEGLCFLKTRGPYAVVVSDMRMPGMDGIEFLQQAKIESPQTVRIMLTAYADMLTAIEAVNHGHIFRFLTKPCPMETISAALNDGLYQYRLIMAERELLGKTLKGSLEILTEILSMVNPAAFGRATRIKHIVRDIALKLQLPNPWQYELAAMLSQIGCVTVPPAILDKVHHRQPLTSAEEKLYATHPEVGRELLEKIPRFNVIARIIEQQQHPVAAAISLDDLSSEEAVVNLGAQLLSLVITFDEMLMRGTPHKIIMVILRRHANKYNPLLLNALGTIEYNATAEEFVDELPLSQVSVGMIVAKDVWSKNDLLLVQQGQEITPSVLVRLQNFARRIGVFEPIRVSRRL